MAVFLKACEVTHPGFGGVLPLFLSTRKRKILFCQAVEIYQDLVIDWLNGKKAQSRMTPRILVLETA